MQYYSIHNLSIKPAPPFARFLYPSLVTCLKNVNDYHLHGCVNNNKD